MKMGSKNVSKNVLQCSDPRTHCERRAQVFNALTTSSNMNDELQNQCDWGRGAEA